MTSTVCNHLRHLSYEASQKNECNQSRSHFSPFEKTQSTVSCILSKITVEHGREKLIISVLFAASKLSFTVLEDCRGP